LQGEKCKPTVDKPDKIAKAKAEAIRDVLIQALTAKKGKKALLDHSIVGN
jgi:hypothetical protein